MIVKVTSRGVTIPRQLFGGAKEAEVREEQGRIVIVPVSTKPDIEPLYELGSDPVDFGLTDASVNHDKYLYENEK